MGVASYGHVYWHTTSINVHWVIWAYVSFLDIFDAGSYFAVVWLINVTIHWFWWMFAVIRRYVDYNRCAVNIYVQCGRHIHCEAYVINVKCMYTSAYDNIIDCIEFIWGIYADVVVSYMHMKLLTCTFEGQISCQYIHGCSMVKKRCSLFSFTCIFSNVGSACRIQC